MILIVLLELTIRNRLLLPLISFSTSGFLTELVDGQATTIIIYTHATLKPSAKGQERAHVIDRINMGFYLSVFLNF